MRFSIHDLIWATLVVAMGFAVLGLTAACHGSDNLPKPYVVPDQRARAASMSPDGQFLAIVSETGLRVWDLSLRKVVLESDRYRIVWPTGPGTMSSISAVANLPDGDSVVTAGLDGRIIVWSQRSGKEKRIIEPPWVHGDLKAPESLRRVPFHALATNSSGNVACVAALDRIEFFHLESGAHLYGIGEAYRRKRVAVDDLVTSAATLSDDDKAQLLVVLKSLAVPSGAESKTGPLTLEHWDARVGRAGRTLELKLSRDRESVGQATQESINVLDAKTGSVKLKVQNWRAFTFGNERSLLSIAQKDGSICVGSMSQTTEFLRLRDSHSAALAFSNRDTRLWSAWGTRVSCWDIDSQQELRRFFAMAYVGDVGVFCVAENGSRIAVSWKGWNRERVHVFDLNKSH
jgi:WD40 repeat protein